MCLCAFLISLNESDLYEKITEISCKVHLLVGKNPLPPHDQLDFEGLQQHMASNMKRGGLAYHKLPNCSHFAPMEHPDIVADYIVEQVCNSTVSIRQQSKL